MLRNFPSEHIFGLPSNRRVRQQVGRATITAACCVVACCKLVRTVPDPGCPRALLPPDGPADRAAGLQEASPAACCKCACMMGCRTKACASSESGMQLLLRASEAFRSTGQSHTLPHNVSGPPNLACSAAWSCPQPQAPSEAARLRLVCPPAGMRLAFAGAGGSPVCMVCAVA